MRTVKALLTAAIIAAALLATIIALFWRQLLTPEQKLNYGLYSDAASDFARRAARNPGNQQALDDYVGALARLGNFGRALYLADLYGAQSGELDELRSVLDKCQQALSDNKAYDASNDPASQARKTLPVYQVMLYLDGYQFALLGDWASAKNNFSAIEAKRLPAQLRPLQQYYLARSLRLSGNAEEQAEGVSMLEKIKVDSPYSALRARARYNLAAYYLSDSYGKPDALDKANVMLADLRGAQVRPDPSNIWALQKTLAEFAQREWNQGNARAAWDLCSEALLAAPTAKGAQSSAALSFEILAGLRKGSGPGGLKLAPSEKDPASLALPQGIITALGEAALAFGLEKQAAVELGYLRKAIPDPRLRAELAVSAVGCLTAAQDLAGIKPYMAEANLAGASDEQMARIYYDYANLLEKKERYNEALSYFKSAAQLGTALAGEASLGSYRILKDVQEPLNLDRAEELLTRISTHYPDSPAYGKAVEELLPLLIYRGKGGEARKLALSIASQEAAAGLGDEARRNAETLREVANFWLAYLASRSGADPKQYLEKNQLKYFNYFELASGAKLPAVATQPQLLGADEGTAEFLAGLGLADEADEVLQDEGRERGPVEQYCRLRSGALVKPLHTQQFEATELLQSGVLIKLGDGALTRYVLEQAYPLPYREEVTKFAAESGVPAELIYAVAKKESNFREDSTSWVGASGLMQLMPGTVRFLIDARGLPADSLSRRNEPAVSLRLGAAYLASLHDELAGQLPPAGPDWAQGHSDSPSQSFGGDAMLRAVLCSYNGGPGNYKKWRALYSSADSVLLSDLVPNEQNEGYIKLVWKYAQVYGMLLGE